LLVLAVTHSPADAGFTAALRALPVIFIGLLGGLLVDRWDRKRIMICCDIGSCPYSLDFLVLPSCANDADDP